MAAAGAASSVPSSASSPSAHLSSLVRLSSAHTAGLAAGLIGAVLLSVILCAVFHDSGALRALRLAIKRFFCGPDEAPRQTANLPPDPLLSVGNESPTPERKQKKSEGERSVWLHYCLPCHVCGKLLRDPVSTETCRHVFCREVRPTLPSHGAHSPIIYLLLRCSTLSQACRFA